MRLTAFRIRNYRSILDTGWVSLSPDNITTLIGQNESGKTSVLEGLFSFYSGIIHEDILRSDLSLPYVSCSFSALKDFTSMLGDPELIKPEIYEKIKSKGMINLNRRWTDQNNSVIFFGDDDLIFEYDEELLKEKQNIAELEETVHLILEETSRLTSDSTRLQSENSELEKKINTLQIKENKLIKIIEKQKGTKKDQAEKEYNTLKTELHALNAKLNSATEKLNDHSTRLDELIKASKYAELFLESGRKFKSQQEYLEELISQEEEKKLELRFSTNDRRSQILRNEIKNLGSVIKQKNESLKHNKKLFQFNMECLSLALSDSSHDDIEITVAGKLEEKGKILTKEELGQLFFNHIPEFKLFEDFSSLLPNRIDMDDILNSDNSVEGFNAVKNFLIVSGIDANFFTEQNNRILKQKIENLNGELTLNFQDYWRQNLGRNNKIKINFELEHYDFSHPVKKGKPYLEFWIKDENERLYPKQRSRGVRWFLSFYLELKATSIRNRTGENVLLIDEPGLSLHARAQEDVLKVFEDVKDNIQIMYSTHSPHLVDSSKLFRILAVQRADEYNDKSESLVFDYQKLNLASADTLSPVYTLLGTRLSESSFLQERNNLIVEDIHVFYYLSNIMKIFGKGHDIYFLPANGVSNIPTLVNLMIGWNLHYAVLLTESQGALKIYNELKDKLFREDEKLTSEKVLITHGLAGLEDIFSTLDFKKFVLQKRMGITEKNIEFIENNNLDRISLSTAFALKCREEDLTSSDFDEETNENVKVLINKVLKLVKN